MKPWPPLLLLALAACSDENLYAQAGNEPFQPDRLTIAGQLCTEDSASEDFPLKVLFVVDGSGAMFQADVGGLRFGDPAVGINTTIGRFAGSRHVRFGFISMGGNSRALPTDSGQVFYGPAAPEVQLAINELQQPAPTATSGERDLENAMSQVESFITADIDRTSPGEVLRTRYIVNVLVAGPPDPILPLSEGGGSRAPLSTLVRGIRDRVYAAGALEFRVNFSHLYYGPRSIDQGTDPFECHPGPGSAGAQECVCAGTPSGTFGSVAYCAVFCASQGGLTDARNATAQDHYQPASFAGEGAYRLFQCPVNIDLSLAIQTAGVQLLGKDVVAFNRNVRLLETGPAIDSDGDGLTDAEEQNPAVGTDATLRDSDGDGLSDRLEFRAYPEQDPLNPDDRPASCGLASSPAALADRDLDLLTDCEEGLLQSSPSIPDTDGDGLPDFLEFQAGTVPTAQDRGRDLDGDGIQNGIEVLEHTNPRATDGALRSIERYRNRVELVGLRNVAEMVPTAQLIGLTFLRSSENIVGGQSYLRWRPCEGLLEWSDPRMFQNPSYQPVPTQVTENGMVRLTAQADNGDSTWAEFSVRLQQLPTCTDTNEVVERPLLTVSERTCYDVRVSNIKLMQTQAADGEPQGLNTVLVFFTQGPAQRLTGPGISKVAEIRVQFVCADPSDLSTCSRSPGDRIFELADGQFISAVP